jgi:hypothetical protein
LLRQVAAFFHPVKEAPLKPEMGLMYENSNSLFDLGTFLTCFLGFFIANHIGNVTIVACVEYVINVAAGAVGVL